MKKLVAHLREIAQTYPLVGEEWTVPKKCPIDFPATVKTGLEKNIHLKENLHDVISSDTKLDCHYWCIQEWGGIGSFKRNMKNDIRIRSFMATIESGKLSRDTFGCISSLSKVASFASPERFSIYDSRAIYTLNWLLFIYTQNIALFPQPASRNAELSKYDMQTIFCLSSRPHEYRHYSIAYHDYCNLMINLSHAVFGQNAKPYHLEMLLFMVAPSWTISSIQSQVSINIAVGT